MIANLDVMEANEWTDHAPRERDLQIYAAVRVDGRRQVDVAAGFGITQGRVSQIVRRVNQWRVGMGLEAELERRDRRSVDRWLEQLRIEKLYEETMELYRKSKEPRRRERRGKDHRGEWSSETLDHQPGNLQCLKFAGRLIELRRQLDEDPPPPDQSLSSPRSRLDEYEAFRLLVDMRRDAIGRGHVPEEKCSEYVVRRMIGELVGQKPHVFPDELAHLAEANAAAACRMEQPKSAGNETAIINKISAATAAGEVAIVDPTDGSEATYDDHPDFEETASGANIGEFFSSEPSANDGGGEELMTGTLATEKWAESMEPAACGVR